MVGRFPMISQLIRQLGMNVATVVRPAPSLMVDVREKTYNIFYVPEARGSPHIPAQRDFGEPHGIRSVLGFGGLLPEGDLFAVILFTKVVVPPETACLFPTAALSIKAALLSHVGGTVFAQTRPETRLP
jgi:hypothetical protein